MSLFTGKIQLFDLSLDIPICADNETEALRYLHSTREWIDDGVFYWVIHALEVMQDQVGIAGVYDHVTKHVEIVGVDEILQPELSPFEGTTACWHGNCKLEEVLVGVAFHDRELMPAANALSELDYRLGTLVEKDGQFIVYDDHDMVEKWDAYFEREDDLVEQFDHIRCGGLDIEAAMHHALNCTDGNDEQTVNSTALARVLAFEITDLRIKLRSLEIAGALRGSLVEGESEQFFH